MVDFAKPQHETLEERLRGLGMHIMFVCTGNICRSPMGELLMTHYLNGTTVQVS
ncbi:MAG: low molecular weight phosphatase family protein, partial [Bifidobacterium adolescentis]